MAFSVKCPKCRREVDVAFKFKSGQKAINCSCGHSAPVVGLSFDPQPEFLFKYRPHDRHSESWILNEELFFASPAMFNDPFDSKVMHTFEGTPEQKQKYLSQALPLKLPGVKKRKKWKIIKHALKNEVLEKGYDDHIARIQQSIDRYGIVSFSQKSDDLLMFAYYARDHSGYCLKYRRSVENILSMAQKITYEEFYPKFSVFEFGINQMVSFGDKVLLTKAKCWEHKDEWRIDFANPLKRVLKSPHPILEGIILGCNMKPSDRKQVAELNKRRLHPVAIFEARKRKSEFALEIVSVKA